MNLYVPVIKSIQRYIEKNPEENVEHILNLLSKVTVLSEHKEQVALAKKLLLDHDSIWHEYTMRGFSHIDPNIIKNLIVKFFVNCNYRGIPKQREMAAQIGVSVPWAILIDPTEACNLQCRGCWAGDYEPQSLSYEGPALSSIIRKSFSILSKNPGLTLPRRIVNHLPLTWRTSFGTSRTTGEKRPITCGIYKKAIR